MKKKLTAEQWEALSDALKACYAKQGDGSYKLELEDEDETPVDVEALKRAKDHEKKKRQEAEAKLREREEKDEEEKESKLKKTGDFDALEKSYKEKLKAQKELHKLEVAKRDAQLSKILVDDQAEKLAKELSSTAPKLLIPFIKERLSVEFDADGEAKTRVLGADRTPSASTLEDLKGEFLQNKDFSAILTVSRASGGGNGVPPAANGNGTGQGGSAPSKFPAFPGQNSNGPKLLSQMTDRERLANIQQKVEAQTE